MERRFKIDTVVMNEHEHCKITDYKTGNEFQCELDELNELLYVLMEV